MGEKSSLIVGLHVIWQCETRNWAFLDLQCRVSAYKLVIDGYVMHSCPVDQASIVQRELYEIELNI